ncbi:hypothetical protein Q7C36_016005 [Tachysurus vachellii]|uniref:Uncharacterized protein n=1 Tax=Tachysurus vachellii TaxID=175792 RepID=A0AA88M9D4_TACVA|nr:hypothetical protein Q7C36_016005 [Tachysurus vachellii]
MSSPRRPIILTRRKRPFQRNEANETQNKSSTASGARSVSASAQDGIRVVDHPTRPEALVVVVPETADLQSVLDALTAKRKERGTPGPNKFIFLSGRYGSDDEVKALFQATSETKNLLRPEAGVAGNDQTLPNSGLPVTNEPNCSVLDDSLTNIQWLGKMSTQVSGPEAGKKDSDKEKFDGCVQLQEQQKRVVADPKKATVCTTERKMKPLLPRKDSYLVPIHLPLTPSLFLPSSAAARSLSTPQQTSTASNPVSRSGCKRLCIAPKVPKGESSVVGMSAPVAEVEEERMCIPLSEPCSSEQKEILRKRYERISRRKQRLVPLSNEEPVLLFPEGTFFD